MTGSHVEVQTIDIDAVRKERNTSSRRGQYTEALRKAHQANEERAKNAREILAGRGIDYGMRALTLIAEHGNPQIVRDSARAVVTAEKRLERITRKARRAGIRV